MTHARLTFLLFAYCFPLRCADFCAVKVFLVDMDDRPASALVELMDSHGRVVQQSTADKGEASFCDFDFGDHSIIIGGTTCSSLIIPHVRLTLGKPQIFKEYLNPCTGGDGILVACQFYFRAISQGGDRLPAVEVGSEPPGISSTTDRYGRAQINIPVGGSRVVLFSKSGYLQSRINLICTEPRYSEKAVILSPLQK